MLTPSERARLVRAELDAIVASLRAHELEQLVVLGRRILEVADERRAYGGEASLPSERMV